MSFEKEINKVGNEIKEKFETFEEGHDEKVILHEQNKMAQDTLKEQIHKSKLAQEMSEDQSVVKKAEEKLETFEEKEDAREIQHRRHVIQDKLINEQKHAQEAAQAAEKIAEDKQ